VTSQEIKDQAFISTSAWVIIVFSFIALYFSCFKWLSFQQITATQEMMFQGTEAFEHDFTAVKQKTEALLTIVLTSSIVGSFLLLITALNLLRRRKSGRILFTITISILLALLLFFLFYSSKNYQQQLVSILPNFPIGGEGLTSQFLKVARFQFLGTGVFCLILSWALVRVMIKMNSKHIRKYFP
jgi:hypothetical protein